MMRRTMASAATPEHAITRPAVKGSQALPPVSGSWCEGAEALAVAREVGYPHLGLSTPLREGRCRQRERRKQRDAKDEYSAKDVAQH